MKSSRKAQKNCCGITVTLSIVVALVFTTVWFARFKPKDPEITAYPVGLENVNVFSIFFVRNIPLNMTITIDNHRNAGSFEFRNATAYVNYRGSVVAEVPIGQDLVPARGKLNTTASSDLMVGKIIISPVFFDDVAAGSLNLTATAALYGKVRLFEFVKIRATALSTCDISFTIASRNVQSTCNSKIKL